MDMNTSALPAAHESGAAQIASSEMQQQRLIVLAALEIILADGEHYAGLVLDEDGKPSHHLVLLPGDVEDVSWDQAQAWAEKRGAALPTRREQHLLIANLKSQFQPRWYWSCEQHASASSLAWGQFFDGGFQDFYRKSYEGRARAVRRFAI